MCIREAAGTGTQGRVSRRRLLGGAAAILAAGVAGCSQVTDYEFVADPVVVPRTARTAVGYETLVREPVVVERSRSVGGLDVTVTVESQVAVYGATDRTDRGTATAPTVGVVSTPPASVMGRSFNPLARLTLANLLTSEAGAAFLSRAGLDDLGHPRAVVRWRRGPTFLAARNVRYLDVQTTLESYGGVLAGAQPTVAFVHLARVDGDDVVVVAGVHGHDVDGPNRPFVEPDGGYLTPDVFDEAVSLVSDLTGALGRASAPSLDR